MYFTILDVFIYIAEFDEYLQTVYSEGVEFAVTSKTVN